MSESVVDQISDAFVGTSATLEHLVTAAVGSQVYYTNAIGCCMFTMSLCSLLLKIVKMIMTCLRRSLRSDNTPKD